MDSLCASTPRNLSPSCVTACDVGGIVGPVAAGAALRRFGLARRWTAAPRRCSRCCWGWRCTGSEAGGLRYQGRSILSRYPESAPGPGLGTHRGEVISRARRDRRVAARRQYGSTAACPRVVRGARTRHARIPTSGVRLQEAALPERHSLDGAGRLRMLCEMQLCTFCCCSVFLLLGSGGIPGQAKDRQPATGRSVRGPCRPCSTA